jgi:hypothetical protein
MANSRELNKTRFFENIIADMDGDIEEEIGRDFTDSGPDATFLPLHRDIYTPLVWVPELGDDVEMTDNTSEEELDTELLEEEELDELDMNDEMTHESELWEKAQKSQVSGPDVGVLITEKGRRAMYKSVEFIEDSD